MQKNSYFPASTSYMTWKPEGTSYLHERFSKEQDLAPVKLTKYFANAFHLND